MWTRPHWGRIAGGCPMPHQARLAAVWSARRRDDGTSVNWVQDSAKLAFARAECGPARHHMVAEQVQGGWFWLAWTSGGGPGCLQGTEDTLDGAKAAAELAAVRLGARLPLPRQFGRKPG